MTTLEEEAADYWAGMDEMSESDLVSLLKPYAEARQAKTDAETVMKGISDRLKAWLDQHPGEELVDGEHGLRATLKERRGTAPYDLTSIAKQDQVLFQRLLDMGCLQVNAVAVKAQKEQVGGVEKYAFPAPVTTYLDVKDTR